MVVGDATRAAAVEVAAMVAGATAATVATATGAVASALGLGLAAAAAAAAVAAVATMGEAIGAGLTACGPGALILNYGY